jgi:predicted nucleotidyltransferase
MTNPVQPLTLAEIAERLRPLGDGHLIERIEVFGSVARGDATATSDVDLLVTLDPSRTVTTAELLDMAGEAEELVGRPVDFVLRNSLDKSPDRASRKRILETAVCIYGN